MKSLHAALLAILLALPTLASAGGIDEEEMARRDFAAMRHEAAVTTVAVGVAAYAFRDHLDRDDYLNFGVSAGVAYGLRATYPEMSDAKVLGLAMIPGAIKEFYDFRNGGTAREARADLLADFVGAYTGLKFGNISIRPRKGGLRIVYRYRW